MIAGVTGIDTVVAPPMPNVPGICLALILVGAGFALTGDLGRLAARGMAVLHATDVPADDPQIPVSHASTPAAPPQARDAAAAVRPPQRGPDRVDIATLAPGSRVVAWCGRPGDPMVARCLAFDVVDPQGREVLVSEVPLPPAAGLPAIAPSPPRRVVVLGSAPSGAIARGGMVTIEPHGIAGTADLETIGPIVAIDVTR